jgi:A/G-specific adenine glycosylase
MAATPWVERLLAWYAANRRPLPWRNTPDPYRIWVSEIMLQQTRVDTVIPYFARFLKRFPTVNALAAADPQDLLKVWEGLGYYSRVRNLQKAARELTTRRPGGEFPRRATDWRALPGVGDYTAAAIASIAFREPVPVVDGNVLRVFTRFWGIADDIRAPALRGRLAKRLCRILRASPGAKANPGDFNQGMMELGATVCQPRQPHCALCPLQPDCVAYRDNRTTEFPVKSRRAPVPHYDVAIGVVWRRGKVLIQRRRPTEMLGGLWEFPGGKREAGETLADTVVRELREEAGLTVRVVSEYGTLTHGYSHFRITLTAFACEFVSGRVRLAAADAHRWVKPAELSAFPMPRANQRVLAWVRGEHENRITPR